MLNFYRLFCLNNSIEKLLRKKLLAEESFSCSCGGYLKFSQVEKLGDLYAGEMDHNALEKSYSSLRASEGYCLKCGSRCDLESSRMMVSEALGDIKR